MALDGSVFGQPGGSSALRSQIMSSPLLNATPSPSSPADVVENPSLQGYYRAYAALTEILRTEKDPLRRLEVEKSRSFVDRVISEIEQTDASAGPPAPAPPPVAQAAMAGPQAGGPGLGGPPPMAGMPPGISGGTPPTPAGAMG